jgi:hypothetical protein
MQSKNDSATSAPSTLWAAIGILAGLAIAGLISGSSLNASAAPIGVMFVVVLLAGKSRRIALSE